MIDDFCRKNDILIFLVAHPRKPATNEAGVYEPSFYDIKGGGEFYDMSPHGILVQRDYVNDVVMAKVLKVKFAHLGHNNKHIYMKWNEENGRYMDFEQQHENPTMLQGIMFDNSNWMVDQENECYTTQIQYNTIEPNREFDEFTVCNDAPF